MNKAYFKFNNTSDLQILSADTYYDVSSLLSSGKLYVDDEETNFKFKVKYHKYCNVTNTDETTAEFSTNSSSDCLILSNPNHMGCKECSYDKTSLDILNESQINAIKREYVITYGDGEGNEVSKTCKMCGDYSCTVELNMYDNINSSGVTNAIVGTYTTDGLCEGTPTVSFVSGTNFLSNLSARNGYVYGTCSSTSELKSGVYRITIGSAASTDTASQLAPTPPPCTVELSMYDNISSSGVTNAVVGTYTTSGTCEGTPSMSFVSGTNFLNNLSASNGYVYGTCSSSVALRSGAYRITIGSATSTDTASQLAPPPVTNYTYTVTSNVIGAEITLRLNGSQISKGTIGNDGKYVFVTSAINSTLQIIASKEGCTFETGKFVRNNETIAVNGECLPPVNCRGTLTFNDGIMCRAATTSMVGEITYEGNECCDDLPTCLEVSYANVAGDGGDFLSNIWFTIENNRIYVIADQTENIGQTRTSVYNLKSNGTIIATASITQYGGCGNPCRVEAFTDTLSCEAGNNVKAGVYSYYGNCGGFAQLSYVSGDNFIEACYFRYGKLYATYSQNTDTSARVGVYTIMIEDVPVSDNVVFTQVACGTPVGCKGELRFNNNLSSSASEGFVQIGTYYVNDNCTEKPTLVPVGNSFLDGYYLSNNIVYGSYSANSGQNNRSSRYVLQVSGVNVSDVTTLIQSSGEAPGTCSASLSFNSSLSCEAGSNVLVGTYNVNEYCSGSVTLVAIGDSLLTSYTLDNGIIYVSHNTNPNSYSRSCQYVIQVNGVTVSDAATLTQAGCEAPGTCAGTLILNELGCYGTSEYSPIGSYSLNEYCSGVPNLAAIGETFLTNYYLSNGIIYATYGTNPGQNSRSCQYVLQLNGTSISDNVTLTQVSCETPGTCSGSLSFNGNLDCSGGTDVIIGTYSQNEYCSGTLALEAYGSDILNSYYFSGNYIYASFSRNDYSYVRGCSYALTVDNVVISSYVTLYQDDCETPPTPTYTYTVNDSNGNAEDAYVSFFYNGTLIGGDVISNGTCTIITNVDYGTLSISATKGGCDDVVTSVTTNSSVSITMTCASPGTCTWCGDINLTISTTYNPPSYASGVEEPIVMFDATPVCEGSFIATYYRGDTYLYDMTVSNIGGDSYIVYASWPDNQGAERAESIAITFVTSEGNYISCEYPEITQPAGPCAAATTLVLSSTSLFTPSSEGGNADIVLDGDVNCYSLTYSHASVPQIHLGGASIMGGSIVILVEFEANDSGDTGKITLKFGNIHAGDEKTFEIDVEWQ